MITARTLTHEDYTVGWICALPCEMAAAKVMLDVVHASLPIHPNDHNTYTLGRIRDHNVVIACLPLYGTTPAATVASQMLSSFPSVRFRLMVGIGGGVPSKNADIRLGDVVVSKPDKEFGGVVQYDYGKTTGGGRFERTGRLAKPPPALLTAVAKLQADHIAEGSRMPTYLSEIGCSGRMSNFTHPGHQQDRLFQSDYDHIGGDTCNECDPEKVVARSPRATDEPVVHYGLIASGNQVIKHGGTRDQLGRELGILCFEMEAAGLMDDYPCLVIRGISDYADSHKNKQWQQYAAATAAVYAKEILAVIPAIWATKVSEAAAVTSGVIDLSEKRQSLLDALGFNQIDARQETIKAAHAKTCKWLLSKPEYQDWLHGNKISQHHGFLWIKGKPGTGKSTLMKFALKQAKKVTREDAIIFHSFLMREAKNWKSRQQGCTDLYYSNYLEGFPNFRIYLIP
jgi:nucleoside phosphorylase